MFTVDDHRKITAAVAAAESRTSSEIIVTVAAESGRYDRAEDVVGLLLGMSATGLLWLVWPPQAADHGSWAGNSLTLHWAAFTVVMLLGFLVGSALAGRFPLLRGPFIPRRQISDEVRGRAGQVFFDRRVHHTAAASGLLIYVSLYEHGAAVVGDRRVVETLGQAQLDELCRTLTDGLKTSDVVTALCATIAAAGARLAQVLPREAGDVDELDDALIILE